MKQIGCNVDVIRRKKLIIAEVDLFF